MLCSHCPVQWFSLDVPSTFWQICSNQYLQWVLLVGSVQYTGMSARCVNHSTSTLSVFNVQCCSFVSSSAFWNALQRSASAEHPAKALHQNTACTLKHDSSVPVGWTQDNDTHKHTIAHIVLLYNKRKVYTHCIIPFLLRCVDAEKL